MSMNLKKIARPTLLIGAVIGGAMGWSFTRPDMSIAFIPYVDASTIDAAPIDAAIDAAIDAPPSPTDWTMVTIASAAQTGLIGADGVDTATIAGKLTVVSPWEQSAQVTVSTLTGSTWATVTLGSVGAVEDAKFCDVDQDGTLDIIGAGQGRRIRVWFGPAPWSTAIDIGAATNVQQWMQVACTTTGGMKIWAGGREASAYVAYFTSATPRTAASWTMTTIGSANWLMSIIPKDLDGDGDLDVLISDRQAGGVAGIKGSKWFRNDGATWAQLNIYDFNNQGDPKFLELVGANTVMIGGSNDVYPNKLVKSVTADNWHTWTHTTITPYPNNVGGYQGVATCDITGDGTADYVLAHNGAVGTLSGVVAINGATGARIEIDHSAGEKYDNVLCMDMDGDGDLDVLESEQNTGLGVIWFKNPRLP